MQNIATNFSIELYTPRIYKYMLRTKYEISHLTNTYYRVVQSKPLYKSLRDARGDFVHFADYTQILYKIRIIKFLKLVT